MGSGDRGSQGRGNRRNGRHGRDIVRSADRDSNATPSVVFLHGIGAADRAWNPQLESFAATDFLPDLKAPREFDPAVLDFLRHAPATATI
jgi:pimeloyl-ACP methyl ester carboxylesterase